MKTTKKKTTDTSQEDPNSHIKSRKASQHIKTVSIFIHNLDHQITRSYAKLRKNREKLFESKQEYKPQQSTTLNYYSPHESSQIHHPYSSILKSGCSESLAQRNDIVLLDNKQVMQYVRLVYKTYNIRDPLEEKQQGPSYSTNKKIRTFKDRIQKEAGSASTPKNYQTRKSIQLNPFSLTRNKQDKKQTFIPAKIQTISLLRKQKQSSNESSRFSTYRLQNTNTLKRKQKINLMSHRSNYSSGVASVPQFFRFCFMCEQPILECNIQFHQQSCEPLKQAFNKTFQQLLVILDQKIAKLIHQINHELLQKSHSSISSDFTAIKASVQNWIHNIPSNSHVKNVLNKQKMANVNMNWRGEFNQIEEKISQSFCSSFHLIHKLQWFAKLRQNINMRYLSHSN